MKRSDDPEASSMGSGHLGPDALVVCPACGTRVESVEAWAIPKQIRPGAICLRWEPAEQWYEMAPCGCEVESFTWRTGVVDASARDLTGRQLPAGRRELTP